jgi:hypothetical protein
MPPILESRDSPIPRWPIACHAQSTLSLHQQGIAETFKLNSSGIPDHFAQVYPAGQTGSTKNAGWSVDIPTCPHKVWSTAADDARPLTWRRIQELCTTSGEEQRGRPCAVGAEFYPGVRHSVFRCGKPVGR